MSRHNSILRHLMLTTALSGMAMFGYGRGAYGGSCAGAGGVYSCTGAVDPGDVTQTLSGAPLSVTLGSGFGIDTYSNAAGGDAFTLYGDGGLTFSGTATNSITGDYDGIDAYNFYGGNLVITTTGGPVQGVYSYEGEAMEAIWEYSQGHPQLVQQLCLEAVNRLLQEKRSRVTKPDVESVYREIVAWEGMQEEREECERSRPLVKRVAEEGPTYEAEEDTDVRRGDR